MSVASHPNFSSQRKWAHGSGCLVCGGNHSPVAVERSAPQCVDLGVADDFLGSFGLCYDHAYAVGQQIGMILESAVNERAEECAKVLDEAHDTLIEAQAERAAARLDLDTAERLFERFGLVGAE